MDGLYYISVPGQKVKLYVKNSLSFTATYNEAGVFRFVSSEDIKGAYKTNDELDPHGFMLCCSNEVICEDNGHLFMSGKHTPLILHLEPVTDSAHEQYSAGEVQVYMRAKDKWLAYSAKRGGLILTPVENIRTPFILEKSISGHSPVINAPNPVLLAESTRWKRAVTFLLIMVLLIIVLAIFL